MQKTNFVSYHYLFHGVPFQIILSNKYLAKKIEQILMTLEITRLGQYQETNKTQDDVFKQQFKEGKKGHELTFYVEEDANVLPLLPSKNLVIAYNEMRAWYNNEFVYFTDNHSMVQLSSQKGIGILFLHKRWSNSHYQLIEPEQRLIVLSLLVLMRPHSFFPLHAAAVSWNNHGVLIISDSGQGKSTLTMLLIKNGWHYISDDSILLGMQQKQITAFVARRNLYLNKKIGYLFPDIENYWENTILENNEKKKLDVKSIYPEQVSTNCIPELIIFPKLAKTYSHTHISMQLQKTTIMLKLMKQSGMILLEPDIVSSHLKVLQLLTDQCEGFELITTNDILEKPEKASNILQQLLKDIKI